MKTLLVLVCLIAVPLAVKSQSMSSEQIVQANLEAYNDRDIDLFMSFFSEEIELKNFDTGEVTASGITEIRKLYKGLFDASPNLHSEILKRTVFSNKIIDHEYITGRNGSTDPLELVLIYETRDNKIFRMTVLRK